MSFMYNPYPYDDPRAVNPIVVATEIKDSIVTGAPAAAKKLAADALQIIAQKGRCVLALDGYISAPIEILARLTARLAAQAGVSVAELDVKTLYQPEQILREQLANNLPTDREIDPPLLYGRLYKGGYEGLMCAEKIAQAKDTLAAFAKNGQGLFIVYGNGCMIKALREFSDIRGFIDVTQKRTVLNIKGGKTGNLGFTTPEPFNPTLRHAYYVDFEVAGALRGELIQNGLLDYYITGDSLDGMQLIPYQSFMAICRTLVTYPFRCRPVYIEGVWGGFYVQHLRNLPKEMRNCAWVFDLIPMEVSIVADLCGTQVEMPYWCFVQTTGNELMGETCVKKFDGYFPIRFNYDDTFHASGNMSIQCHPDSHYVREHNDELGRQDESYYIVVAGQGAKTYCGFNDGANVEEFIEKAKDSEKHGTFIDHDQYVHSLPSEPGMQFMIPAGTIHASGRNQVILEIGSLTIGSYTYKMYDYLRRDLDGNLRPIHVKSGDAVLRRDYVASFVDKELVQRPRLVREDENGREIIVGETDLLYFTLRNLQFDHRFTDETKDRFHVLVLVEGEKVLVRSIDHPEKFFIQESMDMVVVPASFGRYELINQGVGSIVMHKTMLREGYEDIER